LWLLKFGRQNFWRYNGQSQCTAQVTPPLEFSRDEWDFHYNDNCPVKNFLFPKLETTLWLLKFGKARFQHLEVVLVNPTALLQ
jgi:hypothetical protein